MSEDNITTNESIMSFRHSTYLMMGSKLQRCFQIRIFLRFPVLELNIFIMSAAKATF